MANISPKSLTAALVQNWDVIERLSIASRDMGTFELEEILRLIARTHPAKTPADHNAMLQDLSDRGLIHRQPRSDRRQVHPVVLEFVQTLTRERDLGLSDVIKARVEGIHQATTDLQGAVERAERSTMVSSAKRLWQQFDAIGSQLDQDRHAILEIAERAKSTDASLPLKVRYEQVLQAYDRYVDPMVGMMDSGSSGVFHQQLQAAGEALDAAVALLASTHGSLMTENRVIRDAAFQSRELRRLGREVMTQSTQTLLPLRNELRDHSVLAASIGAVLGLVRKRGAKRALTDKYLPFCVRDIYRKISVGPEILTIVAAAKNYTPVRVDFPEEQVATAATPLDIVDLRNIRDRLQSDGGTGDLMEWLALSYPDWQDLTVLAVFHDLSRERQKEQPDLAPDPQWITLKDVRVQHHPLRMPGTHVKDLSS